MTTKREREAREYYGQIQPFRFRNRILLLIDKQIERTHGSHISRFYDTKTFQEMFDFDYNMLFLLSSTSILRKFSNIFLYETSFQIAFWNFVFRRN